MTTQEAKIEAYKEMLDYLGDCKCHRPLVNHINKQILKYGNAESNEELSTEGT